jgi:ferredoxin--NADP+ reductase
MTDPILNAMVVSRTGLSARQIILRVEADGWTLPDFEPGQYAVLGLPAAAPRAAGSEAERAAAAPNSLIRRAYSIASSSRSRETMEFYIGLVSDGALTPRLFALERGDRLWLSPKVGGMFTLDRIPRERNVVLVATGTGLAPYISMLRTDLVCGAVRRYTVLHGAYHSWDLGYRPELETLQNLFDHFRYLAVIDDPQSEPIPWTGPIGRVQDLWKEIRSAKSAGFAPAPENTDVFLCGNTDMIDEMIGLLAGDGFREAKPPAGGEVHVERY